MPSPAAAQAAAEGIPSRGGRSWHHGTARRIIRRTQKAPAPVAQVGTKGPR